MLKLRPYKSCDAQAIEKWIQDKDVFTIWGGERFGSIEKITVTAQSRTIFIRGLLLMTTES